MQVGMAGRNHCTVYFEDIGWKSIANIQFCEGKFRCFIIWQQAPFCAMSDMNILAQRRIIARIFFVSFRHVCSKRITLVKDTKKFRCYSAIPSSAGNLLNRVLWAIQQTHILWLFWFIKSICWVAYTCRQSVCKVLGNTEE